MSVIAKLSIRGVTPFGTGQLVELACVCENDLMAAYATSEEDKLFTKYSPWGEMKVSQPNGASLGRPGDEFSQGSAFYVMVLSDAEAPADRKFAGAYAWCPAKITITDFGDGQAKRLEFCNKGANEDHKGVDRLTWKMSVDNPAATDQIKAGSGYWVVFYPISHYDRDKAIRAAHGHLEAA